MSGPGANRKPAPRLTAKQRQLVIDGSIHGDFTMATVRGLVRKGLFHIVPDSPNGRYGTARLTAAGVALQAKLKAAQ